jgi:hypothetical protein
MPKSSNQKTICDEMYGKSEDPIYSPTKVVKNPLGVDNCYYFQCVISIIFTEFFY